MKLNSDQINKQLENLRGWSLSENSIIKTFEFDNFLKSIGFVNKIAPIAEKMNHHPDIEINYNKVKVTLSTHDEGGVTEKDFDLARKIESI